MSKIEPQDFIQGSKKMQTQTVKLYGYYRTGWSKHFVADNGLEIDANRHTIKNFENVPYMVCPENPRRVATHGMTKDDGFTAVADDDPRQYHQMPIGTNWEYHPRNGVISYRHRAIATIDLETYDTPRLLEVELFMQD